MKALVYLGPGKRVLADRPKPVLELPTDAVVKVTKTTICGTDLHILKGEVPSVATGRVLGHEGVGTIEEVGAAVSQFKRGDRVLISCITSCGRCENCRRGLYSHCAQGGWMLGNRIDGTQAEFVRIPWADTSLYRLPEAVDDEQYVMLSDILPTGYECGVLSGKVSPGSTIAIVGAGPIGLATLLTAQFYAPAEIIVVDVDDNRLDTAKRLGATQILNSTDGRATEAILELSGGRGVDAAIEAAGTPDTFDLCQSIVAPGGVIANIGRHGKSVQLHLEKLSSQNMTLTTRLVDTVTTPMLLRTVLSGRLQPLWLVTHHFKLADIASAYDTFANAADSRALKVMIANGRS